MECREIQEAYYYQSSPVRTPQTRPFFLTFNSVSESISPSVMIPDHRLATLLDQVTQSQISKCHYHNPTTSPSLFSNHLCDRSQFPLQTIHQLTQSSEIWFLEFSHDGTKLATCGKENFIVIYETANFHELHKLSEHSHQVTNLAWSPDDSYLITCSHDRTAKIWDSLVSLILAGSFLFNSILIHVYRVADVYTTFRTIVSRSPLLAGHLTARASLLDLSTRNHLSTCGLKQRKNRTHGPQITGFWILQSLLMVKD